ncbi:MULTISPECIES: MerR family transcriptional regulator [Bacillus]|nr:MULTISPECIES: MerR family transcriptional regulator [Bacillus]MEC1941159.1 MerR family transcriptional regulator [Bacillus velezensis]UUT19225.1 MerR family transcriptional regulator [Bacillus velezensis]WBL41124.1 MerR family transcriptional regulator [Bacillus velezensis]WPB68505.1 MerR family transcriptional regulator [Bacillus velezensis]
MREAAAKCNMTESTLRYYEKKGLLPLIERDEASRRLFSEDQMPLLEIVICLKNTRMTIKGFKQYIDWVIEGESPIKLRLDMMRRHKRSVLDEMSSMTKAYIKSSVQET